jgi:transketolase
MTNKLSFLKNQGYEIRKKLIELHAKAKTSHIGSAFSAIEILVALYFEIMDLRADKFILSKGHAVSALYGTLYQKGLITEDCINSYCINGGTLHGHPDKIVIPQVFVSTGSLGHGLPIGVGIAFGSKMDNEKNKVFVLMGDGDTQEGTTWEAAYTAIRLKLDNLIIIIDANKLQAFERTLNILPTKAVKDMFQAIGWFVEEVDGHNLEALIETLRATPFRKNKPSFLIAHTVKGKGVKTFEDRLEWHYKSPSFDQLDEYIAELRKV